MHLLFDVFVAMLGPGLGRRRSALRRVFDPVEPTSWLAVGFAGLVGMGLELGVVMWVVGRFAFSFAGDDLLFILGLIVLPLAMFVLAAGLSAMAWLARVAWRLRESSGASRLDLAFAGGGGLLALFFVAGARPLPYAVVAAVPPLVCAVVAIAPPAWRARGSRDPVDRAFPI